MAGRGRDATVPAWVKDNAGSVPGASSGAGSGRGRDSGDDRRGRDRSPPRERRRSRSRSDSRDRRRSSKDRRRSPSYSRSPSRDRRRRYSRSRSGSRSRSRDRRDGRGSAPLSVAQLLAQKQAAGSGPAPMPSSASAYGVSAPMPSGGAPGMTSSGGIDTAALIRAALANVNAAARGGSTAALGVGGAGMAATRPYRRLYVGNIPMCSEGELQLFFNQTIARAGAGAGEHVISTYVNHDKKFAFLEFKTVEMAHACLKLDGLMYQGVQLKVRRPNDYNPDGAPPMGQSIVLRLDALGVIASTVPDGPNKIFVGGIPYQLTEEQVKELLQSFGKLKAFHLVRDAGSVTSKGYAFCEYQDPQVADVACAGLHGLPLGDKQLTIRRATPAGQPIPPPTHNTMPQPQFMGSVPTNMGALAGQVLGQMGMAGAGSYTPAAAAAPSLSMPAAITRAICLTNLATADDLATPEAYADLQADVQEELSNYGQLTQLLIPRQGPAAGSIYAEYQVADQAAAASGRLAGRSFAGRLVAVRYVTDAEMRQATVLM